METLKILAAVAVVVCLLLSIYWGYKNCTEDHPSNIRVLYGDDDES